MSDVTKATIREFSPMAVSGFLVIVCGLVLFVLGADFAPDLVSAI